MRVMTRAPAADVLDLYAARELRSFRVAGTRYVVMSVSPLWGVRPEILTYWRTVRFRDQRPSWLTMDLYPDGMYAEGA